MSPVRYLATDSEWQDEVPLSPDGEGQGYWPPHLTPKPRGYFPPHPVQKPRRDFVVAGEIPSNGRQAVR